MIKSYVNVIGCGFAGIECALFLAGHGIKVHLFDTGITYKNHTFIDHKLNPKQEMFDIVLARELSVLGSPLIRAEENLILEGFRGNRIEEVLRIGKEMVRNNENIQYFQACVHEINPEEINIIATGPYTDKGMYDYLYKNLGAMRCFDHMPVFPILDNVDMSVLYTKESCPDCYFLPLNNAEYSLFVTTISRMVKEELENVPNFKIMPNTIEDLILGGKDNLRNIAFNAVLMTQFKERPYAVIKLRKNQNGLVINDFFTNLSYSRQLEIFRSLKGFTNASIIQQAGSINVCYLNSKFVINDYHQSLQNERLFFAGGILGLDGWIECVASGLYAGIMVNKYFQSMRMVKLPSDMCLGRLSDKLLQSESTRPKPYLCDFDFNKNDFSEDGSLKTMFDRSLRALERFKEEYRNGKYV